MHCLCPFLSATFELWRLFSPPSGLSSAGRIAASRRMENDFVDVFPSAGGVGDSPVKGPPEGSSTSNPRSLSLSLTSHPGLHTGGGREALVSPRHPSLSKEGGLRSARTVSEAGDAVAKEEDVEMLEQESQGCRPGGLGLALSIDPVDDCAYVPTELEKKKAKLEKYKYECSEVGGRVPACAERR